MTAKFIETDHAEATNADGTIGIIDRHWYDVDGTEFAITSDNRVLDADGKPLTDGDSSTVDVRRAIEAA